MNVAIATIGSRGDHLPFLALAQAFLRAGHQVRLGGDPGYASLASSLGVPYVAFDAAFPPEVWVELLAGLDKAATPAQQQQVLMDVYTVPLLRRIYPACLELACWGDVVISHTSVPTAAMGAEVAGRPWAAVLLVPPIYPTRAAPPPGLPNLGPLVNPLLWWVAFHFGRAARPILRGMNQVRMEKGFRPLRSLFTEGFLPPSFNYAIGGRNAFLDLLPANGSPQLDLIPVSPHVVRPPRNRPRHHHYTGYWFVQEPYPYTPPPEVEAWLAAGPRPVVLTFSTVMEVVRSLPGLDEVLRVARRQVSEMAVQAVEQAGVRAVVYRQWFAEDVPLPPAMLCLDDTPHSWLLPRAAGVVHHGGAGTSAAALRAGIPSAIYPEVWDQMFWANTLHALGVATAPVLKKDLSAQNLAQALSALVRDQGLAGRAQALGARVQAERGADEAVRIVHEYYG